MNLQQCIPTDIWNELTQKGNRRIFNPETPLMHQGDTSNFVVLLSEGTVKVTEATIDGHQIPLALRGAGELLGEMGVLLDQPRSSSVWTVTECLGYRLSKPEFLSLHERHSLGPALYRVSTLRERQRERRLGNLLCCAPDVRMARLLADLAVEVGERSGGKTVIHIGMDRTELGFMLKMSRATAFGALKKLKALRLISSVGNKQIIVLDLPALQNYSPTHLTGVS
jgi:CRP-like cAMP-binding protein